MARPTKRLHAGRDDRAERAPVERTGTVLGLAGIPPRPQPIEQNSDPPPESEPIPRPPLGTLSPDDEAFRCPSCGTVYSGAEKFCPFDGDPLVVASDWDPTSDPLIGQKLSDRYVVEGVLAEGGMGKVYRVRHARLGNVFAMKVLRLELAEDADVAARLIEEARATAAVGHANIVAVSDFGEIDARAVPALSDKKLPYFVMEYVPGGSLADLLRREGALAPERAAAIALQVASALAAAHAAGIIHRDLKPSNVRLSTNEAGGEIAKVLDFGVAKVIGSSPRTREGMVFGTPHYMSPEQGQGLPIDHRTDVYALGVILYECLTGEVPFVADTYMGVVTKHMKAPPPPIEPADPAAMPLEPVLLRCLQKAPDDRYASMNELARELETLVASYKARAAPPLATVSQDALEPALTRRPLWPLALVALAALLLAVGWWARRAPTDEPLAAPSSALAPSPPSPSVPASATPAPPSDNVAERAPAEEALRPPSSGPRGPRPGPPPPEPRRPSSEIVDPWAK